MGEAKMAVAISDNHFEEGLTTHSSVDKRLGKPFVPPKLPIYPPPKWESGVGLTQRAVFVAFCGRSIL